MTEAVAGAPEAPEVSRFRGLRPVLATVAGAAVFSPTMRCARHVPAEL
jgi:hypothetical protein